MRITFILAIIALSTVLPANAMIDSFPGLYTARLRLFNTESVTPYRGLNFTLRWREVIPSIKTTALGLWNFKTLPDKKLSFTMEMVKVTPSSGIMTLNIDSSRSGIQFLIVSIIVVNSTKGVELVPLYLSQRYNCSVDCYRVTPKAFNLSSRELKPSVSIFLQWMTLTGASTYSVNWTNNFYFKQNHLEFSFIVHNIIDMKINVLMVARVLNGYQVSTFSTTHYFPGNITRNFGLNSSMYGYPTASQRCIIGFKSINQHSATANGGINQYVFEHSPSNDIIGESVSSKIYGQIDLSCFGYDKSTAIVVPRVYQIDKSYPSSEEKVKYQEKSRSSSEQKVRPKKESHNSGDEQEIQAKVESFLDKLIVSVLVAAGISILILSIVVCRLRKRDQRQETIRFNRPQISIISFEQEN